MDLFGLLGEQALTADDIARVLTSDTRATVVLLDTLTAMELLQKREDTYVVSAGVRDLLTPDGRGSVLAMVQHQANCLRRWAQLSEVVKTGKPAQRRPSLRGEQADDAAFIGAMDDVCAPIADEAWGIRPVVDHSEASMTMGVQPH